MSTDSHAENVLGVTSTKKASGVSAYENHSSPRNNDAIPNIL
jgi:hypothetical protein